MCRLYRDLADWWPLVSTPADYEEEATFYSETIAGAVAHPVRSVLELGSGGGNRASWMKTRFDLTLVDRAPEMLAVSRRLNPGCRHDEAGEIPVFRARRPGGAS